MLVCCRLRACKVLYGVGNHCMRKEKEDFFYRKHLVLRF